MSNPSEITASAVAAPVETLEQSPATFSIFWFVLLAGLVGVAILGVLFVRAQQYPDGYTVREITDTDNNT